MMTEPTCRICGEIILAQFSLKKCYCSDKCSQIGHNELAQERKREMSAINRELGRCIVCNQENDNLDFDSCTKCRKKGRDYYDIYKLKGGKKKNGSKNKNKGKGKTKKET